MTIIINCIVLFKVGLDDQKTEVRMIDIGSNDLPYPS